MFSVREVSAPVPAPTTLSTNLNANESSASIGVGGLDFAALAAPAGAAAIVSSDATSTTATVANLVDARVPRRDMSPPWLAISLVIRQNSCFMRFTTFTLVVT